MKHTASRRAVAALFLERQWLDRPRARRLTAANLEKFVTATCGLQIDSINVIERAHQLTLWSRFDGYERATLDKLIYRKRVLFEYLTHVACFAATRDLPLLAQTMQSTKERWQRTYNDWPRRNDKLVAAVEGAIRERGPLGNADFERPGGGQAGGWWSWKPATHALDYLWKAGRIGVHSRQHFQKRYDLMERVLPTAIEPSPYTPEAALRERLLRSLAAMGAAAPDDLRNYWTWPRHPAPVLKKAIAALVSEGRVAQVHVEGQRQPWLARLEDLPALARAGRKRSASAGTTLLCPFDSFLWYRERTLRLFGYHYRIEVYVPKHKREHGYYSLPLLHEGHLLGRVDAKIHRADALLEVHHVHFEPWFARGAAAPAAGWDKPDPEAVAAGLAGSLVSLAHFVAADRVELRRTSPARLGAPIKAALRTALRSHA